MNKQKFLREDYKTYKPKYKAYCNQCKLEKIILIKYENILK